MYDINNLIINEIQSLNDLPKSYIYKNINKNLNRINYLNYGNKIKYKIQKSLKIIVNPDSLNEYENNEDKKIQERRNLEAKQEKNKIILSILTKIKNIFSKNQDILLKQSPFNNKTFLNSKISTHLMIKKEEFIDQLHELLDEYNFFYDNFLSIEKYISNKIKNDINQVNKIIDQVDILNKKIEKEKYYKNKIYINVLCEKKNNLIDQLNKIIAIHINSQDADNNIRIFNNILLVSKKTKYHIQNNHDPINQVEDRLCFLDKSSNTINLPLSQIIGEGRLSGLANTYLNSLVPKINQLRQIIYNLSQYIDSLNKD